MARGVPADTQGFFHGTGNGKRPRNTASSRASAGLGGPRGTVLGWPVGSTRVVLDYPKVEHRNPGVPGPAAGRMRSRPPGHGADQPRSPSPVVAGGPRPDRPGRPSRGALLEDAGQRRHAGGDEAAVREAEAASAATVSRCESHWPRMVSGCPSAPVHSRAQRRGNLMTCACRRRPRSRPTAWPSCSRTARRGDCLPRHFGAAPARALRTGRLRGSAVERSPRFQRVVRRRVPSKDRPWCAFARGSRLPTCHRGRVAGGLVLCRGFSAAFSGLREAWPRDELFGRAPGGRLSPPP